MLQFIEEFYKIFHQQYKSCLTYLVHSWNAKNHWVDASSISLYEDALFEIVFKMWKIILRM